MKKKFITFVDYAYQIIDHAKSRVKLGEASPTLPRDYEQRLKAYCIPFFAKTPLHAVDHPKLRDFKTWLAIDRGLKGATVRTVMSFVSKVLSEAAKDGLIRTTPSIPRPKQEDCPRPAFTRTEYQHLLATLKLVEEGKLKVAFKGHAVDRELRDMVTFAVNAFLRPGDLFQVRNRHVEVVDEGEGGRRFLRMNLPKSKAHDGPTVSMKAAVDIYKRVLADHKKKGLGGPDDFVFLPHMANRAYAKEVTSRQFISVLTAAKLRKTASGEARSLYSLRHYAITARLVNADGLDAVTLAKNCRTSPEMIHRFYASSLRPEMNLDKIQSFKRESRHA